MDCHGAKRAGHAADGPQREPDGIDHMYQRILHPWKRHAPRAEALLAGDVSREESKDGGNEAELMGRLDGNRLEGVKCRYSKGV